MPTLQQMRAESRFWAQVKKEPGDGCWLWTGRIQNGYGRSYNHLLAPKRGRRRTALAHRIAYEMANGPIAQGLTIDHLCRNRACVRPAHLRPCTVGENVLAPGATTLAAINKAKAHCINGHEFTPQNTAQSLKRGRVTRACRACWRERKQKAARLSRESSIGVSQ